MTTPTLIIGYVASTTSVVAFGSQFYHTIKTKTTAGLSLPRSIFDSLSLGLWVLYATRVEDIPLLIATITELVLSVCVCAMIVRNRNGFTLKDVTPPPSPPRTSFDSAMEEVIINVIQTENKPSV